MYNLPMSQEKRYNLIFRNSRDSAAYDEGTAADLDPDPNVTRVERETKDEFFGTTIRTINEYNALTKTVYSRSEMYKDGEFREGYDVKVQEKDCKLRVERKDAKSDQIWNQSGPFEYALTV